MSKLTVSQGYLFGSAIGLTAVGILNTDIIAIYVAAVTFVGFAAFRIFERAI